MSEFCTTISAVLKLVIINSVSIFIFSRLSDCLSNSKIFLDNNGVIL